MSLKACMQDARMHRRYTKTLTMRLLTTVIEIALRRSQHRMHLELLTIRVVQQHRRRRIHRDPSVGELQSQALWHASDMHAHRGMQLSDIPMQQCD